MVCLLRQIIQNNPHISILNMYEFSLKLDREQNIGELVLESLLSSNINSITNLDLSINPSWFRHLDTNEER